MGTNSFVTYVRQRVEEIRQNYPGLPNSGDAFAVWAVHFLHPELTIDEALECASTRGGKGAADGGVDAIVIDDSDGVVYLLQAKFPDDPSTVYDASPYAELLHGLDLIKSPLYSEDFGGEFAKKAEAVRAALAGGADLVMQVVVFGRASDDLVNTVHRAEEDEQDAHHHAELWDLKRLDQEWTDRHTVRDLGATQVELVTAAPIAEVNAAGVPGLETYRIAVLDGRSLAEVASKYGARLVDMNVRYQLRRTKINDSIAETATDPQGQSEFLVLNNGLTVVCDSIVEEKSSSVVLLNPQIVNGAQTALTLGDNIDKLPPGKVRVLARLMVVDKSDPAGIQLARRISEATNRQNPVSASDLKAHDPLQIRIESDLLKLVEPWYYERRRNSWASLSEAEKKHFAGFITKEDLGQRYRALSGEPAKAITAKASIFDSTTLYGQVFDESIPVERYLLADQLFEFYQGLLAKAKEALRAKVAGADMDETTRLMLMRARNQFAAHAVALAYSLLQQRYKSLDKAREYAVAKDARSGGDAYLPLHRLVVMTIVKWARLKAKAASENSETFSIKDEFESSAAFATQLEDAKMMAQFLADQTLNQLPD